ncbi:ABC transporter permease [Gordonia jinhuaensis]|uniref:ABC transporter, permease protein n=1 Tax=Gordonia jinhuaensis TaxID=1517702 RepID=A0A916TCV9_9ACTN|nr:ABC transporter permease [Gordonia jinhuaensis]GGB40089.1 putative ABC transporter, permease protein [Gordonia jinhuaensis]
MTSGPAPTEADRVDAEHAEHGQATVTATATATSPDTSAAGRSGRSSRLVPSQKTVRQWIIRVAALVVFLFAWWVVTAADLVKPLYLPGPGAVWDAFVRANTWHQVAPGVPREVLGEQNYFLWEHLIASLQRIFAGVGIAIVVGVALGVLMGTSRAVATVIEPYLNFLRALPPLGYFSLLIVWFGIGDTSKIWLLFLAAFPAITVATVAGISGIKQDYINAARSLGARRRQVVTRVVLPAALPDIINGIRLAVGFAWTTVVAAELNNGIPGIGGLAYIAGTQLRTPLVIACIIVIGITALVLDSIIKWIGVLAAPWKGKA